jgi:hypothetical protein
MCRWRPLNAPPWTGLMDGELPWVAAADEQHDWPWCSRSGCARDGAQRASIAWTEKRCSFGVRMPIAEVRASATRCLIDVGDLLVLILVIRSEGLRGCASVMSPEAIVRDFAAQKLSEKLVGESTNLSDFPGCRTAGPHRRTRGSAHVRWWSRCCRSWGRHRASRQ